MRSSPHPQIFGPAINRFADVMEHADRFAFKGVNRLAREAGVSPSSVSRLINGKMNPSFLMVARLTKAIERQLGFHIDPRDLVAESGEFLTPFTCDLVSCRGCLPDRASNKDGSRNVEFSDVKPGQWATSRYPKGYAARKGGK